MRMRISLVIFALAIGSISTIASSYELRTHGLITDRAYQRSILGSSPNAFDKLGLQDSDSPFGEIYYDFGGGNIARRWANAYEQDKMPNQDSAQNNLRIRGWIMRGAIREDDGALPLLVFSGEPYALDPDPSGNIYRFCNHFFDPVNLRALTTTFLNFPGTYLTCPNSANLMAPNWAVGSDDAFAANAQEAANFRNHYTVFFAREAMWRALTLRQKDGSKAPKRADESDEDTRKGYWATTFRSVGDVLHLNQDMAQPQHTRNESHGVGHEAIYEKYLDARALPTRKGYEIDAESLSFTALQQSPLPLTPDYIIPKFSRYADYWSTAPGAASVTAAGKGLADYSSRGFLTPAKNVNVANNDMVLPNRSSSSYSNDYIAAGTDECSPPQGGVRYLLGTVPDSLTGAADPIKMASDSLLSGKYGLNRCVFDERAKLLLPRAVAYSAGLIDYFFRGELEISLPDEGVYAVVDYSKESTKDTGGFNKVKLKLRNKTPSISPSGGGATVEQKLLPSGVVVAVAKFRRNKCYIENTLQGEIPVRRKEGSTVQQIFDDCRDKVEEIVVSDPVTLPRTLAYSDADPVPLTFDFKDRIPINVMDLVLQVVYRGKLGDETDAVVVTTKDVSEPTFFKMTDYFLMSVLPGTCTFQDAIGPVTTSPISIALTESATTPPYLVKAELNGKDYAMFAAISDLGPIKGRGVASWNGGGEMILSSITSTMRFEAEFQPGPTLNSYVTPTYRQSQFYPTAPNTLTLMNDTPPKLTKIRGVFADTGFFLDNNLDYKSCGANPNANYLPTEGHSLMPPHSPLVPKALKELNF